jgi:hypothetical protein
MSRDEYVAPSSERDERIEAARRRAMQAEHDLDPAQWAPDTIGCHEALHAASMITAMADDYLAEHPAIMCNPEWKRLADEAVSKLNELYQAIGREHLKP